LKSAFPIWLEENAASAGFAGTRTETLLEPRQIIMATEGGRI
jgi:hypothetical protein